MQSGNINQSQEVQLKGRTMTRNGSKLAKTSKKLKSSDLNEIVLQILGHVSIKESYFFLFHLHSFMYKKCSKVNRYLLRFQFLRLSHSKCLLRQQETGTKVPLGAKRSKKPGSYLLLNFSNNSKMLTLSLARIGQIFPAIFSESNIFLIFKI